MASHSTSRRGFIAAAVALACQSRAVLGDVAGIDQDRAIGIIRDAGGIVVRDRHMPKHPVVTIRYDNVHGNKPIDPQIWAWVGTCGELRELEIERESLADADLRFFSELGNLRTLRLNRTEITDAGVALIAGLTSLEELEISSGRMTDAGLKSLANLHRLRVLRPGYRAEGDGLDALKNLPNLQVLDLFGVKTSSSDFIELRNLPALKELDLDCNGEVRDAELKLIGELPALEKLVLFSESITDDGLKSLCASRTLRSLFLSSHGITPAGIGFLENLPTLEELQMHFVSDACLRQAARLGGLTSVGATRATDATLHELRALKHLRRLDLVGGSITNSGLKELSGMTGLEALDLSSARKVTDAGMAELSGLKKLEILKLAAAHIKNASVSAFEPLIRLRELELPGGVNDAGLDVLAKLPQLACMNLECSDITDAGAAKFKQFPSLKRLTLGGSVITGAGLKALSSLSQLDELEISSTLRTKIRFTDADFRELQEALPYTEVHRR